MSVDDNQETNHLSRNDRLVRNNMAGGEGHHQPVRIDPAVERWNFMRENVYQHFKFTPRATRQVLLLVGLVPAAIGYAAWTQDRQADWAGKRRGESLLASSPASAQQ